MLLACLFLYSCTPRIYFTSTRGQNCFPILSIFRIWLPKSETGFSKTGFKFETILGAGFASEAGINVTSSWVNYFMFLFAFCQKLMITRYLSNIWFYQLITVAVLMYIDLYTVKIKCIFMHYQLHDMANVCISELCVTLATIRANPFSDFAFDCTNETYPKQVLDSCADWAHPK